jgi:hypothetical protein
MVPVCRRGLKVGSRVEGRLLNPFFPVTDFASRSSVG